jgi:hypothetical protein
MQFLKNMKTLVQSPHDILIKVERKSVNVIHLVVNNIFLFARVAARVNNLIANGNFDLNVGFHINRSDVLNSR